MCIHCGLCVNECKKNAIIIKHSKIELIKIAVKHSRKNLHKSKHQIPPPPPIKYPHKIQSLLTL